MSTYSQFDHNGSGGFGQVFGYSVRPETNSLDGYFNSRQAFLRWVWCMVSNSKNCSWSTTGCADDDFITFVALHDARRHTSSDNSTVAIDVKSLCAWSETQKRFKTCSPTQQRVFISSPTRWWTTSSFFGGTTKATTYSIPSAVRIRCVNNSSCELDNSFDGIITTYSTSLWTTQADGYIHHRTKSTWENGSMGEHIVMVETSI